MPRTLAASGTVMVKRVDSAFTPKPYRYLPGAWVFCNHDGTPISPNYFSIMWSRAVARADLPKRTFHSLRHSHASALIHAGLDVVRVSRQLGHSNPTITLSTYAHEFREGDSGAADAIGKVLG